MEEMEEERRGKVGKDVVSDGKSEVERRRVGQGGRKEGRGREEG